MSEHDDGEQGPDTDGLARYMVADGHEVPDPFPQFLQLHATIDTLQARIARKEAANEALYAKLEATMADMRSLQRQNENWRAECQRLSALLVEMREQLAQRMAMPANALRHGDVR